VLALVQALTEFLPVSSSGHLALAQAVMEVEGAGLMLSVALHFGTLLAVLVHYRTDLLGILRRALRGDLRLPLLLAAGTVPAVVVGLVLKKKLAWIFEDPRIAACGLLATACILLWGEASRRRGERAREAGEPSRSLGFVDAVVIGCFQAVAILPGISRSGSTISAGMSRGLDAAESARISFLLAIPAIGGAALLEAKDAWESGLSGSSPANLVLGIAVSALLGYAALRVLLVVLSRGAFGWFAVYCAVVGVVALVVTG
jgi:undecaprenyl-diphosphatase